MAGISDFNFTFAQNYTPAVLSCQARITVARVKRRIAARLGLQNLLALRYNPRQAPRLSQMVIERYGDRSTSALWSNHDSSLLRGSFLTTQIQRQYPQADFSQKIVDTKAFQDMREAMGPVKIM